MKKQTLFFFSFINIIWICLSIYSDIHYFVFDNPFNERTICLYIIIKFFWIISALLIEYFVYVVWKRRRYLFGKYGAYVLIYGIVYLVLFAFLFPGNWGGVGDELLVYWAGENMWIWPQQGDFSGALMIWQLMFFHSPCTPIIFQMIISCVVFVRIAGQLAQKNKSFSVFFIILSLSPIALFYTFCPMRMWIFSLAIIGFAFEYYFAWNNGVLSFFKIVYMTFLQAILVVSRTEGKYYLIVFPVLLWLLLRRIKCDKNRIMFIGKIEGILVLCVIIVSLVAQVAGGSAYKFDSLKLVSTVCPLSRILTDDEFESADYEAEIEAIDKVFPIEDIMNNPSDVNFWNGKHWIDNYDNPSKEMVSQYLTAYLRIVSGHVTLFVKSRNIMLNHCLSYSANFMPFDAIVSWCENNHETSKYMWKDFHINQYRRELVENAYYKIRELIPIVFNFYIPLLIWNIAFVFFIFRKDKCGILLWVANEIEFVILYLSIPNAHNMYYVPFYFLGWISFAYFISRLFGKNVRKLKTDNTQREE